MKLLEEHDPLRVSTIEGLIGARNKFGKESYPRDKRAFTRHDRLVNNLEDWMHEAFLDIRNNREIPPVPTDLIEDDPVIKKTVMTTSKPVVIIVSDDRKLVLECEKFSSKIIYRISMKDWFLNECDEGKFILALKAINLIIPNDIEVIMDSGSLEAHMLKTDWTRKDRTVPKLGWHTNIDYTGLRYNKDDYIILEGDYPRDINNLFIERFMHISSGGLKRLKEYQYALPVVNSAR